MKVAINSALKALVAGTALVACAGASAQAMGEWTAKGGIGKITPKVTSGDISAPALPGTKSDVGSATNAIFSFAYGLTDNVSAELDLGLPFKHKLYGAGSVEGVGQVATIKSLPPTALIQYRFFEPNAMVRPYAGLGLTYAYFTDATGSGQLTAMTDIGSGKPVTFKIKNKFASTLQFGTAVTITGRWFADVAVTKTFLKTKVTFSTGQTQDTKLDPLAVTLALGYRF
jgi:outer membrane protein